MHKNITLKKKEFTDLNTKTNDVGWKENLINLCTKCKF